MGASSSTPKRKISAQDKAILDLKNQRDALHRYQTRLTSTSAALQTRAQAHLRAHNRAAALATLRLKKHQETLLSRTDAHLAQLEQLASEVEFAAVQAAVLHGLREGTRVLAEMRREMGGVEGVERVMAGLEEEAAVVREVEGILAERGGMSVAEEEEVEEELAALEREVGGASRVSSISKVSSEVKVNGVTVDEMPVVPRLPLPVAEEPQPVAEASRQEEEEESAQLVPA